MTRRTQRDAHPRAACTKGRVRVSSARVALSRAALTARAHGVRALRPRGRPRETNSAGAKNEGPGFGVVDRARDSAGSPSHAAVMTREHAACRFSAALTLVLFACLASGANGAGFVMPGGECSTTADCYGGRACLGGRCCAFTQTEYEQGDYSWSHQNSIYDPHTNQDTYYQYTSVEQNGKSGCVACGGTNVKMSDGSSLPDGSCIQCNSTTTRLVGYQDENGLVSGLLVTGWYDRWSMEGQCASPCDSGMYMTADMMRVRCETLKPGGQYCSTSSFGDGQCESGLCGYEACCATSDCATGVCSQGNGTCTTQVMPGGECSTTADCYGGRACLGGRCCAFTQTEYEQGDYSWSHQNSIYDPHTNQDTYYQYTSVEQNGKSGCVACGGTNVKMSDGSSMPDGSCIQCNSTTTRLEGYQDENGLVSGLLVTGWYDRWSMEGQCASPCDSGMYMTADMMRVRCETLKPGGQYCSTSSFGDGQCESGLCGYEACCATSDCATGVCSQGNGTCTTQVMPGGECSTTADCYGGRACLGGRCCAFTQTEYEQGDYSWSHQNSIYDPHTNQDTYYQYTSVEQNGKSGCVACGGTNVKMSDGSSMPDGSCIQCNSTTTRLEGYQDENGLVSGLLVTGWYDRWSMEGQCGSHRAIPGCT